MELGPGPTAYDSAESNNGSNAAAWVERSKTTTAVNIAVKSAVVVTPLHLIIDLPSIVRVVITRVYHGMPHKNLDICREFRHPELRL